MKGLLFFFLVLTALSCGSYKNRNPPAYILDVNARKEGKDRLLVYMVLADQDDEPTASAGTLMAQAQVKSTKDGQYFTFWTATKKLSIGDFKITTVGSGSLQRETLLYTLERIRYEGFSQKPWLDNPQQFSAEGRILITFKTEEGKTLTGQTPLSF